MKAQFEVSNGCAPYDAFFNNTSLAGRQFIWDFGDGTGSTEVNPTHLYADTGTYVVHLLALDDGTCNLRDSTTRTVQVHPKPTAALIRPRNPPTITYRPCFTIVHSAPRIIPGSLVTMIPRISRIMIR